jgi:solute carrier family 13 (sodium-dependent dicarboxylate transporter), member 2/3/5
MKRRLTPWRVLGIAAGLVAFLVIALVDSPLHHVEGAGSRPAYAAAVTSLMAIWWLTEALPILVTACVPLVMFPLLGVFGGGLRENLAGTVRPYVDPYIWLFLGGMAIAASMQQWRLHKRIALSIMKAIGTEPKRLLLGLLVSTAFISLWISNTATATMMLPIGLAIVAQLEAQSGGRRLEHFGAALMLAIAYASNVGGIGTKIGTAPNTQFAGFCAQNLHVEVSFLSFLALGLPFVVMFLPIVWLALWRIGRRDAPHSSASIVERELEALGPMRREEKAVLVAFLVTAALWMSSQPITALVRPLAARWVSDFSSKYVEGTISLAAGVALVATRLLDTRQMRTVPWLTLILLGGGFSMAAGIEKSGLSSWLGSELRVLREVPPAAQVAVASVSAVALSAVCSNTATVAVMLGVLYRAVSRGEVMGALAATTLGASCDFMLPAGTPPNAIVFGSGYLTIGRMAKTGVVLDLAAAVLVAIWCSLVPHVLFPTPP